MFTQPTPHPTLIPTHTLTEADSWLLRAANLGLKVVADPAMEAPMALRGRERKCESPRRRHRWHCAKEGKGERGGHRRGRRHVWVI